MEMEKQLGLLGLGTECTVLHLIKEGKVRYLLYVTEGEVSAQ